MYPTRDGRPVLIAANQDTVFARLAEAMGQPALAADPRFRTHARRGSHQEELDALIRAFTVQYTADELTERMSSSGVPAGGLYRAPEMLEDAHFAARQAIIRMAHPTLGKLAMQNVAPKLSTTPGRVRTVGPELGEHNREVLAGILELRPARLEALAASGVI